MPRRTTNPRSTGLLPLDYMLNILNDPDADPARKDKLAIAAAPYCHPRAESVPKKAKAAEAAGRAGDNTPWEGDLDGGWQQ